MSGEVRVDPMALRRLAGDLDSVVAELSSAQSAILESELLADAFSPAGVPLAYAFAGAIEYAGMDAYEQAGQVASIQERLEKTAQIWEASDEFSTVEEC